MQYDGFPCASRAIAPTFTTATPSLLRASRTLFPFAAGTKIIRQGKRELTLVRMTPDLDFYDSDDRAWGARDAWCSRGVEIRGSDRCTACVMRWSTEWPRPLRSRAQPRGRLAAALRSGGFRAALRAAPRLYCSELGREARGIFATSECPFTGEQLAAVPASVRRGHHHGSGRIRSRQRPDRGNCRRAEGVVPCHRGEQ